MSAFTGPTFRLVETIEWEELARTRSFGARSRPLLVKGAVRSWPAWTNWSFERLAELRRPDGSEVVFRFQNGLVEQGVTRQPLDLPIGPYLRELVAQTGGERNDARGLLPRSRLESLGPEERFHLDW